MASSARLRLSAQQKTAERNVALALVEESRHLKAARAERKRRVRLARQKIARYRAERLRELESRHARRCGPRRSPQTSEIQEEQPRDNGRVDGNHGKGREDGSCASDDRNEKAQHSRQRRAIEAALSSAVGGTTSHLGNPRGLDAAEEDEPSSCGERGIERRAGSHGGKQWRGGLQGSEGDTGEAGETWHGRDYYCCGRDHGSPAQPLGKPPLAPSRAVPSRSLSPQGKSEVTDGSRDGTDGRSHGTDEDGGTIKRYTWEEENDADEVQTETTSTRGIDNAGDSWGGQEGDDKDDHYDDDDRNSSVWEEDISSSGWNWEEGSAAGGGSGAPLLVREPRAGTRASVNPGESSRGRPDGVKPRHGNSSGRLEGFSCRGRDERDVDLSDGLTRGAGLLSGVPGGRRRQYTESEPSSSALEPSTYAPASPVMAMGEGVAGADRPVAHGPREKTRVRGGNVGGTGNVLRHNVKPDRTPASTMVETDQSIGRGGQHGGERGTPADDPHRRGGRTEGEEHAKSGSVARAVFPPESENVGRSTASQARGESRAPAADNRRLGGGEGVKPLDGGPATEKRADNGNTYAGREEREENQMHSRGEDYEDSDNSRWSLSGEDAAQEQSALQPETSVGVDPSGGVTVSVPEYQDDFFFEGSARQDQGEDTSFAVSPPSDEEPEAFEATPTSPPFPATRSMVPPTNPQPRSNSPNRDSAGDDWLIREPPTMAANKKKTRLGEESIGGRRSLHRPRPVGGGNAPDARPVSPPAPILGAEGAPPREMEADYFSAPPVHASLTGGERRHVVDAAGRGSELAPSFSLPLEDTHGVGNAAQAAVTLDAETRPAGSPPRVGNCSTSGGNVLDVSVGTGVEPAPTCGPMHADSDSGPSVIGRPASSPKGSPRQSLRDDGDDDGDVDDDGDGDGDGGGGGGDDDDGNEDEDGGGDSDDDDDDDDGDGDDDDLGGSASKTLRPASSSSSPIASSDTRGKPTVDSQRTPSLDGGDQQQPQGSRPVLERDTRRNTAPRPTTLSSPAASSGSHADSSVELQPTPSSSREGDTSTARTTLQGFVVTAQAGVAISIDDGSGSRADSGVTENSSGVGEGSSLGGGVLGGDGGGIDTADNGDVDGYF